MITWRAPGAVGCYEHADLRTAKLVIDPEPERDPYGLLVTLGIPPLGALGLALVGGGPIHARVARSVIPMRARPKHSPESM